MDKIIKVSKKVDGNDLMSKVAIYMQSRISNCAIETGSAENTYTVLVTSIINTKKNISKSIFITIQIELHEDLCIVSYRNTKTRPVFNIVFAVIGAPVCLPASGVLLSTAAYRLIFSTRLKKDLFRFIECYVN